MPVMALVRCMAAAVLLFSLPLVQCGDFLSGLKKIVPKSTAGTNADALAKVVSRGAAKALPIDVAGKFPDKDSVSNITRGAVAGSVKDVAGSLMKDSAEKTLTSSLQSLESSGVVDDIGQVAEKAPEALDAVQNAQPRGVASALRDATPLAAAAVNRTSLRVADVVRAQSPKWAALLNRTGHAVADKFDGGIKPAAKPSWLPTLPEVPDEVVARVRRASDWGLAFVVVGVLSVAAGATVIQHHRSKEPPMETGPALLSEVLEGASAPGSSLKRPAREPAIQADGAQMSLFQRF